MMKFRARVLDIIPCRGSIIMNAEGSKNSSELFQAVNLAERGAQPSKGNAFEIFSGILIYLTFISTNIK